MGKIKERKNQQMLNICAVSSKEYLSLALGLETLREALEVFAVIIDHVFLLHPSKPVLARSIKCLNLPRLDLFFFFLSLMETIFVL